MFIKNLVIYKHLIEIFSPSKSFCYSKFLVKRKAYIFLASMKKINLSPNFVKTLH